jgi:hypothetical protein
LAFDDTGLKEKLIEENSFVSKHKEALMRKTLKWLTFLIYRCFVFMLKDLLYVPLILLGLVFGFWRIFGLFYDLLSTKYNLEDSIKSQISSQRNKILDSFIQAFLDFLAILAFLSIFVTILRVPYLILVMIKNKFRNSCIGVLIFGERLHAENWEGELETRRIILLVFVEMLYDIVFLAFGLILLVMAPWRIFTLWDIYAESYARIPIRINYNNRPVRLNLSLVFKEVFVVDYLCFLECLVLILTVYKIPRLLMITGAFVFKRLSFRDGVL